MQTQRWTSQDLDLLPDDGKRYEIIDGELYVSKQPHFHHQIVCGNIFAVLRTWSEQTHAGTPVFTPGVIFDEDDDVVPDVAWISRERLPIVLQPDGKLHASPELVVEVLSPGAFNERRDRDIKRKLYSRRGVLEYWVVNWQDRRIEIYRRRQSTLTLVETLTEAETLRSPLLPGCASQVQALFTGLS